MDKDELIERLIVMKMVDDGKHGWFRDRRNPDGPAAAEAIEALTRERDALRTALCRTQWELETIDRTKSTDFSKVTELLIANRQALAARETNDENA